MNLKEVLETYDTVEEIKKCYEKTLLKVPKDENEFEFCKRVDAYFYSLVKKSEKRISVAKILYDQGYPALAFIKPKTDLWYTIVKKIGISNLSLNRDAKIYVLDCKDMNEENIILLRSMVCFNLTIARKPKLSEGIPVQVTYAYLSKSSKLPSAFIETIESYEYQNILSIENIHVERTELSTEDLLFQLLKERLSNGLTTVLTFEDGLENYYKSIQREEIKSLFNSKITQIIRKDNNENNN